ncbi:hypothetical protein pEaSNUABM30_00260 [Erwinia phage pEa_SNUABM_30]|uniref:HTH cro/C1-type domain-containing protein n=1 Tax=Erwinia phage pEa_SNUABM_30 TaxID=2869553 RepID=A0AAE8XLJ2_9CAUD|nr:hypothetical protein MPK69_gp260 [Erwinia phage pEa_SNUABM_30]UAW53378.1 hypothetical protein pEaSNUABM30_00260 [Erwinia phage pEa_SNUABM_30]
MEIFDRSNVVSAIMRNLKDVRKIKDLRTFDDKVYFQLNDKGYFVSGKYPELKVICQGQYDYEMMAQLNFVYQRKKKPSTDTPLRLARMAMGVSLVEVAKQLDIDAGNLSRIERGIQIPAMDLAERIAKYFNNTITAIQICHPTYKGKTNA